MAATPTRLARNGGKLVATIESNTAKFEFERKSDGMVIFDQLFDHITNSKGIIILVLIN